MRVVFVSLVRYRTLTLVHTAANSIDTSEAIESAR